MNFQLDTHLIFIVVSAVYLTSRYRKYFNNVEKRKGIGRALIYDCRMHWSAYVTI